VGVSVALAASPEHRRQLFELRRRVYVTELGGTFPESVVANGQLREQVDDVAFNYALLDQGRVVGSLRVADLHRIDATPVIARYRLETLVSRLGLEAFTLAGRLALEPAYRNGGHMLHLVDRAYRDARARGISYAVSDCSPCLVPLYLRLGYRVQGDAFDDPIFGAKIPIIWPLEEPPLAAKKPPAR
jgi:GNAT superfamily N-acetyltransferase